MERRGPWTRHDTQTLLEREPFSVHSDRVTTPGGTDGRYDWIEAPDVVRVAALTGDGRLYLIEQHHYLPNQMFLQLPGGGVGADETPAEAAARELAEEVGAAGTLTSCGTVWPLPGLTTSRTHLFRADDLRLGATALEESEADLAVRPVPLADAVAAALAGRIACAASAFLVLAIG